MQIADGGTGGKSEGKMACGRATAAQAAPIPDLLRGVFRAEELCAPNSKQMQKRSVASDSQLDMGNGGEKSLTPRRRDAEKRDSEL